MNSKSVWFDNPLNATDIVPNASVVEISFSNHPFINFEGDDVTKTNLEWTVNTTTTKVVDFEAITCEIDEDEKIVDYKTDEELADDFYSDLLPSPIPYNISTLGIVVLKSGFSIFYHTVGQLPQKYLVDQMKSILEMLYVAGSF